jgi:hypothetical protein
MEAVLPPQSSQAPDAAQRRAWLCIVVAFGIWCSLVVWLGVTANTWRKTAYSTPTAQLVAKRGIVLYQGPRDSLPVSIAESTNLDEGGTLQVPASSEAVVQLGVDGSRIRVRAGSELRFSTMRVGRFNRDLTQVRLEQLQGAANFDILGELPDGREVEVLTPHTSAGDGIKLTKGSYLVWVQSNVTRLLSYRGQAKVQLDTSKYPLRDGRFVVFGPDRAERVRVSDLPEQLIRNRDFMRGFGDSWSPIMKGEPGRPDRGGERTMVEEAIGDRTYRTLWLTRDTEKDTHNETGLRQEVDREVWAYQKLTLSAFVKVTGASLDGGGTRGSEYPLMLRVKYVAENGGEYTWAKGFYVKNETGSPTEIGEQLAAGVWYEFKIDMMQLKDRPAFISEVEVVAAGHDYDSQVADIQLAAETPE